MKHFYLILIPVYLLLFSIPSYTQEHEIQVQGILEEMIQHAEEFSLFRQSVNWDSIRMEMFTLSKGARNVKELSPALKFMLRALGDIHAKIYHNTQIIAYYPGKLKPHQKSFDLAWYNEIKSGDVYLFKGILIAENIGYIRIGSLPNCDMEEKAKMIQEKVCELKNQGAKKWILDLRYNGGGNMFPMIEGLTTIIGKDEVIGGAEGLNEAQSVVWEIKDGDFYNNEESLRLANTCLEKKLPKVAVLTSLYTASSGEILAIIFKGRKNTKFFGEKTLGMTTGTDFKIIDDFTAMSISVNYFKDRSGIIYKDYVDVDEYVKFQLINDLDKDEGIKVAKNWLEKTDNH